MALVNKLGLLTIGSDFSDLTFVSLVSFSLLVDFGAFSALAFFLSINTGSVSLSPVASFKPSYSSYTSSILRKIAGSLIFIGFSVSFVDKFASNYSRAKSKAAKSYKYNSSNVLFFNSSYFSSAIKAYYLRSSYFSAVID